jgi:hypothetical protein
MAFWYLFISIYSYAWVVGTNLGPEMAGMVEVVFTSPMFYLSVLLVPAIALAPDVILKSLKAVFRPNLTDHHKLQEMQPENGSLSERSALLLEVADRHPVRLDSMELTDVVTSSKPHSTSQRSTFQRTMKKSDRKKS